MAQVNHKRGDTFTLVCSWTDSLGAVVDLTGYTIKSQVRVKDFVDDLTVTVTNATQGKFELTRVATSTELWPISSLLCDVQFTKTGVVTSSDTFTIVVEQDITQ